jgi:hypothetical protein
MLITQLSIFVQDKVGRVAEICELLGARKINIIGFNIADTTEGFGILHLVVDDAKAALEMLHANHITAKETTVICSHLENKPGMLSKILSILSRAGLSVSYLYLGANNNLFIGTDQNEIAAKALADSGFLIVPTSELA